MLERTVVVPSLRRARRVEKSSRFEFVRSKESWTVAWLLVVPWSESSGEKLRERVFDVGFDRFAPSLVSVRVQCERAPTWGNTLPTRRNFSIAPQSKSRSGNVRLAEFVCCELYTR